MFKESYIFNEFLPAHSTQITYIIIIRPRYFKWKYDHVTTKYNI